MRRTRASKSTSGALVFSLMAGYTMIYVDKAMISTAVIPIAKQYHLDTSQTGLIMSFFFLGYSLMQIPSGWLADRFGAKRVLMASMAFIGVFTYCFGMANGLIFFVAARLFAGMGHGGYPPSCSKSVAENFPKEQRTFVQSLILSTSGIGSVLFYTIGAALISVDWRIAYLVLGSCFLVSCLLIFLFVPKESEGTLEEDRAVDGAKPKVSLGRLLRDRNVLALFAAMLLINILIYGNGSWLPTFITSKFGLSIQQMGWILAFNAIIQTVFTIYGGSLLSGVFLGKERLVILSCTVISSLSLVAFAFADNLWLAMACLVVFSNIVILAFICLFTWPHKIMDEHLIGSAIGIINTGGTIGGFLAPFIGGTIIKAAHGSFMPAFVFLAVVGIISGLTSLLVKVKD
ncbi:MFS transporter [Bifidobacterium aemilianum]|uniref:MFS transporter n=1 Tax=Bifidobacterium aemilianum TaxID=2493120 RepID=A0A366KA28_9BIFI|nr:MFS transporter [Bifidobacterium aemilianum]RBP98586.1 MFS transporter [Bifidobacterium aemilianum]